ncbi:Integral membrane protein OS=Streptomyces alboniger OX=132473 GN=CP975_23895 PE=4 SV=1 [Streptomyces alboniger]
MSADQTPTPEAEIAGPQGPRPGRLVAAAALTALEGLALVVGGAWMFIEGFAGDPDDRRSAVTGGVTLIVLALLPLLAARGLLGRRGWSRGPAVITQIMALPVAYNLLQADSVAIPAGIALGVVAIAALVLLVNAATTQALGIKGPGRRQEPGK